MRVTVAQYRALMRRLGPARDIFKLGLLPRSGTQWEELLDAQLRREGYAGRYVRELRFLPDRRFRFDFAFPRENLAVEIDGVVHRIKKRFDSDREKHQLALMGRWRVLHVSPAEVRSGHALALVCKLLA